MNQYDFITHRVNAGESDYWPGHGHLPRRARGFRVSLSLSASAWFDPSEAGPIQRDGRDWNKAAGVSWFSVWKPKTWRKNHCAAIIAWRPSELKGVFELAAYTNDERGGRQVSHLGTVHADHPAHFIVDAEHGRVSYRRVDAHGRPYTNLIATNHDLKIHPWTLPVGPWFGGNRDSPFAHHLHTKLRYLK